MAIGVDQYIHKPKKPTPKPKTKGVAAYMHKPNATQGIVRLGITPIGQTGIGDSQFDSFNDPTALLRNLNAVRAERQPWLHQATNAVVGGLASGLLTAGETISHILDIPGNIKTTSDYFSKDEDINVVESSMLGTFFKETKEKLLNEYMPIYKKNPSKMIDFHDSAFYWEAFRSVLDSAVGFGLTGLGAGAAVKAAGTGLRLSRLGGYTNIIGRGLNATGKGLQQGVAGRLSAAYITNFGEGKIMALELYERASQENYKLYIDKYKADNNGEAPSDDEMKEFEHQSKVNAGKQANVFMMRNKLFIASDYLQLNRMFNATGIGVTNKLVKAPSFKGFAKAQFANGPKEALEEIGQNVIQMEGIHQTRSNLAKRGFVPSDKRMEDMSMTERFSEFAMSEQALLEGAMGFFGGPVQYAITQAPFQKEANKQKMEHFTSQAQQFAENKEYVNETLYKDINKKLAEEKAEEIHNIDNKEITEITNDLSFNMMALRNFAMGTTKNFKDQIADLKEGKDVSPETIKNIDKQLEKIDVLEKEYLALQKYTTSEQIMALSQERKSKQAFKDLIVKNQKELEVDIMKRVTDYNTVTDTQYSYAEYLNNKEDLPTNFTDYMDQFESVQVDQSLNDDVKNLTKQLIEIDTAIDQFKNNNNQAVLEYIKENVITPSVLTEDKIKMLRLARTKIKGDNVKNYIDRQISTLQSELDNVIDNEGIEEQGGVDNIVAKAKEDNIKSDKPTASNVEVSTSDEHSMQDMFGADTEAVIETQGDPDTGPSSNPSDVQVTPEEFNASDEQIDQFVADAQMGILPTDYVDNMFDSKVEAKQLEQQQADLMMDKMTDEHQQQAIEQGITPVDFKKRTQENEAASTNEDITDAQNWNDDSLDSMAKAIISKTQPAASTTNTGTDVKISFNNVKSPKFMEFLNSNEDKTNVPVEYVVDEYVTNKDVLADYKAGKNTERLLNELAIKVVIKGDSENYTYLFKPRKLQDGTWGNAGTAERQLRSEIIAELREGKRPTGKIKYQYSGAFSTDKTPKSVLEINGFESSKDVKIMYVNKEGHLYDSKDKEISTDYNNVITVKSANVPWAGALFTEVKSPNGTKIPMKLNLRKLSKNEIGLIIGIYTNMISPSEFGKANYKDRLMSESSELYDLLPQEDKEFLGENVKVNEVLDHLIFNGTKTIANPATQVYYNKGILNFGKNSMTVEEMRDMGKLTSFQRFLEQFKSRTVNINKLKDPKYKAFVLDNQIINTDVAIDESGNIFQSDESNSSDPKNRYKTKAIYVNNYIDKSLDKSDKKTSLVKKKEEIMKKVKEVTGTDKVVSKNVDKLRKKAQAKVDRIKKKDC